MKIWNRIKTRLQIAVIGMKEEKPLTAAEKRLAARVIKQRVIETDNGIFTCVEVGNLFGRYGSARRWWKHELFEKFGCDIYIPTLNDTPAGKQNRLDFCDEMIKKYGG